MVQQCGWDTDVALYKTKEGSIVNEIEHFMLSHRFLLVM